MESSKIKENRKKLLIGRDYEDRVKKEYKDKIIGKIGGYCIINTENDIIIQGANEVKLSRLSEPLVQYRYMTGDALKFMHQDFKLTMDKLYETISVPIYEGDGPITNDTQVVLTYWVFNKNEEAKDMLTFILDVIEKSIKVVEV